MLVNPDYIRARLSSGLGLKGAGGRAVGTSTAQALEFLAEAIRKPGRDIKVVDHYGTTQSSESLTRTIGDIADKLALRKITIRPAYHTIRSDFAEEM